MDKNDIIRMAREAGMVRVTSPSGIELGQWWGVELMDIERFADLVASAERERIIAANAPEIEAVNAHIKALEDAIAVEREACAKVCSEMYLEGDMDTGSAAGAIRARGNQ